MEATTKNRSRGRASLLLDTAKLYELRRANGIATDAEFARRIGVDPASLYRYTTKGARPSNEVLARIKAAFPLVALDDLVKLEITVP
ncbi:MULTISPECIES: helix-turn-helix domain-containing protein [unclassified Leucobacter]|uniref:helix-turn-helix domain-containing protein n=1 Tax=unclassified Leucobacter TaxID=2621730 RepID=UPI000621A8A7|nr:helix-turn-helix transcriptional regulator [Leucobacter sp. Ag1]KKI16406.1 hypothetical protein XM48_16595 [Leucobacter sp. Ag1]